MVIDYLSIDTTFRDKLVLSLAGFGILAVLIFGYTLGVNYLAVSGYGDWAISSQEMIDWLCLLGILVMALSLIGMLFYRFRQTALRILLGAGLFVTVTLLSMWWSVQLRYQGFVRLSQEAAPLVAAIKQYEAEHGQPPRNLNELDVRFPDGH